MRPKPKVLARSKRMKCRYCGRAFANIGLALAHRENVCNAQMPAAAR